MSIEDEQQIIQSTAKAAAAAAVCQRINVSGTKCKSKRMKINKQRESNSSLNIVEQMKCSCDTNDNNNNNNNSEKVHNLLHDQQQQRQNRIVAAAAAASESLTTASSSSASSSSSSLSLSSSSSSSEDEDNSYNQRLELQTKTATTNMVDLKTRQLTPDSNGQCPVRALKYRNGIQTLGGGLSERQRNRRGICNKHMPWFGIDVGGSLVKVVFFDPREATSDELITLKRIRRYLKSSKPYGATGKRDEHLEMPNCLINKRWGSLHFIRFATSEMPEFLAMAQNKRFAETVNTICATGGGACKFEEDLRVNLGIKLHKTDELDSIIYGIHYIDKYNSARECYFLEEPLNDEKCIKVPYDFSRPYPYLVVNIGSGVSILAVYSSTSYSRISGSSIGGGTFLGLCCLLTQCETFDEAIQLAKAGSSQKIDKLVKDIYGGDYPKFNLSGDTVASNFGHMNLVEKRKLVKREDLARALLEMVTINIGSIARMCAVNEGIDRVVFIGNFLRVNQLSMKLLSYAVNYWSKGAIKALFLEHEGYFGAVGCFVESTQGCTTL